MPKLPQLAPFDAKEQRLSSEPGGSNFMHLKLHLNVKLLQGKASEKGPLYNTLKKTVVHSLTSLCRQLANQSTNQSINDQSGFTYW